MLEPPQLRINLLRRLLANVAGIEDNQVGGGDILDRHIAGGRHDIRHARGVVDVHLAAVSLDVELFGQRFRKRIEAVRTGFA
jgi:hypothetical protein